MPTGINKDTERRKKYETIHELIKHLDEKESVYYCNLIDLFIDKNENLDLDLYSEDGIHLKEGGYLVWGDYIRNKISKIDNDEN